MKFLKKLTQVMLRIIIIIAILVYAVEFFMKSTAHIVTVRGEFGEYSQYAKHINHAIDDPILKKNIHENFYKITKNTGATLTDVVDLYSAMIEHNTANLSYQEELNATEAIINYAVVETVESYEERSFYVQRMQGINDILRRATFQNGMVSIKDVRWLSAQLPLLAHAMAQSLSGMPMGPEEARAYLEKIAQNGALQAQAFLQLKDDLEKSRKYVQANQQFIDDTILFSDASSVNHSLYWLGRLFIW